MERSIATLKVNTIKNETRTKNDIKKRTKENTQLIVELNSIKFEEKKLKTEIMKKNKVIDDLESDLSQIKKNTEDHQSQMESRKSGGMRRDDDEDDEDDEGTDKMPSLLKGENSNSQHKLDGIRKGITPFMKKKENIEDKARINELNVTTLFDLFDMQQ